MHAAPLVMLAHAKHVALTDGFLPAAHRLGLPVVLLTDRRLDHLAHFNDEPDYAPQRIIQCDVFNPLAVIEVLRGAGIQPAAIFSNSDHLQTATALAAAAFDLPGKDRRVCDAARNKAAMRARLAELGLPAPWFRALMPGQDIPEDAPWPLIAKPCEGVARRDIKRCDDFASLRAYLDALWQRHPDRAVLLEAYLDGPLFTLETLGDGRHVQAIGGFDIELAPPHLIARQARWNGPATANHGEQALAQILAFGLNFGACHSEFVLTEHGPALVAIDYRSIGDGRAFLLDELCGRRWFETILRLHLGESPAPPTALREHAVLRYYLAREEGRLIYASPDRAHADQRVRASYRRLRREGEEIRLTRSSKDYLGMLSVSAQSEPDLTQALEAVEAQLHWEIVGEQADCQIIGA